MKTEIIEKLIEQYEEEATRWAYLLEVEPDLGISIEARAELTAISEENTRRDKRDMEVRDSYERLSKIAVEQNRLEAIRAKRDVAGDGRFGIAVQDDDEAVRWRELEAEREHLRATLSGELSSKVLVDREIVSAALAVVEKSCSNGPHLVSFDRLPAHTAAQEEGRILRNKLAALLKEE